MQARASKYAMGRRCNSNDRSGDTRNTYLHSRTQLMKANMTNFRLNFVTPAGLPGMHLARDAFNTWRKTRGHTTTAFMRFVGEKHRLRGPQPKHSAEFLQFIAL